MPFYFHKKVLDCLIAGFVTSKQHFVSISQFFSNLCTRNRINLVRNGLLKCPQKSSTQQLSLSAAALSSELSLTLLSSQLWLLLVLLLLSVVELFSVLVQRLLRLSKS